MSFRVKIAKQAGKNIKKLGPSDQKKLRKAFERFRENPPKTNVKKVRVFKDKLRFRIGKIRIIYSIDHASKTIWVDGINYRKDAYRRLK